MSTNRIKITINGKEEQIPKINTLADLISLKELDSKKIVIEKNLQIIDKNNLHITNINENDKIEIISFVGGG
jgi:thiamine biosynthesis protein ThiS